VILYLGICGVLFIKQRSLIYFPTRGSGDAATLTLATDAGNVLVGTRTHEGPRALIYFGGNGEDVSRNMPRFSRVFPDRAIYLMHYRGYSGSAGEPSEEALFADGLQLFDEVHAMHPQIEVVGRSLGSGVAVYVASKRPAARLVLITPYDSLGEIAADQYPYVPVSWLLLDKFESWKYAPQVTAPATILAAGLDDVIPLASTERLRSRFRSGQASFSVVAGVGHNTIQENPGYDQLLKGGE
jgi:pimeloyl-ACP methyl ester carboxylesterase